MSRVCQRSIIRRQGPGGVGVFTRLPLLIASATQLPGTETSRINFVDFQNWHSQQEAALGDGKKLAAWRTVGHFSSAISGLHFKSVRESANRFLDSLGKKSVSTLAKLDKRREDAGRVAEQYYLTIRGLAAFYPTLAAVDALSRTRQGREKISTASDALENIGLQGQILHQLWSIPNTQHFSLEESKLFKNWGVSPDHVVPFGHPSPAPTRYGLASIFQLRPITGPKVAVDIFAPLLKAWLELIGGRKLGLGYPVDLLMLSPVERRVLREKPSWLALLDDSDDPLAPLEPKALVELIWTLDLPRRTVPEPFENFVYRIEKAASHRKWDVALQVARQTVRKYPNGVNDFGGPSSSLSWGNTFLALAAVTELAEKDMRLFLTAWIVRTTNKLVVEQKRRADNSKKWAYALDLVGGVWVMGLCSV